MDSLGTVWKWFQDKILLSSIDRNGMDKSHDVFVECTVQAWDY